MQLDPSLTLLTKTKSKGSTDLLPENIKLLKENIGRNTPNITFDGDFSDMMPKARLDQ